MGTIDVGALAAGDSAFGCRQMIGNVWEWTASFYDKSQNSYVVRGGSWVNSRDLARVASRDRLNPVGSDGKFGLRLVSPVF